jgi:hypothetical protein
MDTDYLFAARQQQKTPQAKKIVSNSYVPGVYSTAFSMQGMVKESRM